MKYNVFLFSIAIVLCTFINSCTKCYNCEKKCGTCTKAGNQTLFGCNGDSHLNGISVDSWKLYLESQGYNCVYNNQNAEICNEADKDIREAESYTCVKK